MCGIAGHVGTVAPELLPAMLRALKHRGPDDSGLHEEPGLGLGMTRLSIIDLATGHQPMSNEDGSLWIVFNGEIYNYRGLRPGLEAKGHRLTTHSDTEVILHLYEEEGERCVERLRGMFAFAIWDAPRRRLFLARDRLGKKPLFYWHRPGLFLFASEIKALLLHPAVSRTVDWEAFHHYLAFGYTPADRSIFAGIAKLPPAHAAILHDDSLTLHRYWTLPPGIPARQNSGPPGEETARIRQVLSEAVKLRLESDVPLGVFLSGGIDSSAVVACMREVTGQRIATFSIGFGTAAPSFDELRYARMVAQRFETDHTEEILEPKVAELLPTLVDHFDEPFADSSAIPTFVVAQATARHVKVALSGIGGDETFAGYPRYLGVRLSETYRRVPRGCRDLLRKSLLHCVPETEHSRNWADWIRRFSEGVDRPMPDRYLGWTRFFGEGDLLGLATPALRKAWGDSPDAPQRGAYAARGHADVMDGAFRIDLSTYLPDDLLVMADRMSMANSLELRAPFCDHRLVEESLRSPPGARFPGFRLKGLLKAAFADVLPPSVSVPPEAGVHGSLGTLASNRPKTPRGRPPVSGHCSKTWPVRSSAVGALKHEHMQGVRGHADRLWTLMMAEMWMRRYLDAGGGWSLR